MKIVSLWQPWATLACTGHKPTETRPFNTSHRGPLLIHAAKKWDNGNNFFPGREPFKSAIGDRKLSFGAIIGIVHLVDTFQMGGKESIEYVARRKREDPEGLKMEVEFGDWNEGRWGWVLRRPALFDEPIPLRGLQGMWAYDGVILCPNCKQQDINSVDYYMHGNQCPCGWPNIQK